MASFTSTTVRAAAVLTTAEVAATTLDLATTFDGCVTVLLDFTLGSLTNCTVRFYGSDDGVTFRPLHNGVASMTETITGSTTRSYILAPGTRYFYASVQGSGTVTSSSATLKYSYQLPLVVANQDGALHIN